MTAMPFTAQRIKKISGAPHDQSKASGATRDLDAISTVTFHRIEHLPSDKNYPGRANLCG
jgi:hypothetical protein